MYVPIGCCRLNLNPPKRLALKCRHNICSVSVVRFLRFLAKGISLSVIISSPSPYSSPIKGEGIYYFLKAINKSF